MELKNNAEFEKMGVQAQVRYIKSQLDRNTQKLNLLVGINIFIAIALGGYIFDLIFLH